MAPREKWDFLDWKWNESDSRCGDAAVTCFLSQFAAVLDGVLSKLSRYDEGTFFSSILSFTVSSHVLFVETEETSCFFHRSHRKPDILWKPDLSCAVILLLLSERWKQLPNMWKFPWVSFIIEPVHYAPFTCFCFHPCPQNRTIGWKQ